MYTTPLEKRITKYVQKFGIKRAYLQKEGFSYFPNTQTVKFSIRTFDEDELLIKFIEEKYDIDISDWYFIFSLLHEIGHHKTLPCISISDRLYDIYQRMHVLPLLEDTDRSYAYFNLYTETLADEWAIKYIEEHPRECWEFQRKCVSVMQHMYKKKSFKF